MGAFSASQIPSEKDEAPYDLRGARSYPTLDDEGQHRAMGLTLLTWFPSLPELTHGLYPPTTRSAFLTNLLSSPPSVSCCPFPATRVGKDKSNDLSFC